MNNKYWKSIQEKQGSNTEAHEKQQAPDSVVELLADDSITKTSSRRDFLKWCGISFVSATVLSACENPVKRAIPYLNQPEEVIPGKSSWYASSYVQGSECCPVLVRTREGRPVKIEGNNMSMVTMGGTSARVQASLLSLYDEAARYKGPRFRGGDISWQQADQSITEELRRISNTRGRIVLVTSTILSPSALSLLQKARGEFPSLEIITWEPISYSAIRQAHQLSFGRGMIPDYRFQNASLIISFSANFLGNWISPVEFAYKYAEGRRLSQQKKIMSRHIQFESSLSLTGANADDRVPVKPSDEKAILMALHDALARATGNTSRGAAEVSFDVNAMAYQILENRGKTLVICGHNDPDMQLLVNSINLMAGSYGSTIATSRSYNIGLTQEQAFENLLTQMEQGEVDAMIFHKVNPLYSYQNSERFSEALANVRLSISFATLKDETAEACQYILPDNHYLESWGDAEFKTGHYSLMQPVIHRIFNTRQFHDTLLRWMGNDMEYHEYMRQHWQKNIFRGQGFDNFWRQTLQAGVYDIPEPAEVNLSFTWFGSGEAFNRLKLPASGTDQMEYSLYPSLALFDGTDANNPWLQELPDPISSVTWDNFAAISPQQAEQLGLIDGDRIKINNKVELPVLIQPGQAYGSISIALGYGRTHAGISGDNVGGNGFMLVQWQQNNRKFEGKVEAWEKTGSKHVFARTQTHFSMEGRPIVRETTLEPWQNDPSSGNELHKYHQKHMVTLYPEHLYPVHHWLMMVDLNACTGCSSCVIGCQSENNIPVIGKTEVARRRIMHWIRIDRYYSGNAENPGIVFQPLMCQHCDHAPCENVCPVAATPHSTEGLNQMAYNRCVGTKYCINNCPYKVRRFNWFAYSLRKDFNKITGTDLGRMVLNPDVIVRERGVVEKCSFCIQRIQEAKLLAKSEGRKLRDGEVAPACVSACPSKALIFGDRNDPDSRISQMLKDPRNYHLLEELHTLPSVGYLTKVRNPGIV
jgi:Fe-S-cluster-containing dehydrogenase component/anaerobic selenocysteine-containing dehydrogenase